MAPSEQTTQGDGATAGRPRRRERGLLILVLGGLCTFGPATTDVYLPGLPDLASSLDVGTAAAQATLTACFVGIALGQLLAGPLSDAAGRRRPLLLGLLAFVLASLTCAAAPSLPFLVAARVVQGLAGAAGIVISRAMVRDLFVGVEAGRIFSILSATLAVGPILAPVLGSQLLLVTDWRGIFVALAAFGLMLFIGTLLFTGETLPTEARRKGGPVAAFHGYRRLLAHRRYMAFVLTGGLGFGSLFAYVSASSFVYQDVFGLSPQVYGLLYAVNGAGLLSVNLLNGILVGRLSQERLLRVGIRTIAIASGAIAFAALAGAGAPVVLSLLFVVIAASGLLSANALALSLEGEASHAGSASALFGFFQWVIAALVGLIVGAAGSSVLPMGLVMSAAAVGALVIHGLLLQGSDPAPEGVIPR